MMRASFVSLAKHDRLRVAVLFEKEVEPFANVTTTIGVDVGFLIAGAVVVRKFLVVPELEMADSVDR